MNLETIVIAAVIGVVAGGLTSFVMKGGGYGVVGDMALGFSGGILGGVALWMNGIAPGGPRVAMVGAALVGAVLLIVVQRKFWNPEMAATR
jgi:uncharacterized membrane protein YeaQ/YmgE (transglycosylase-associated protein family)